MKSVFKDIVLDGIAYNQRQIKKLRNEIAGMYIKRTSTKNAKLLKDIGEIILYDKKLIADYRKEIASLRTRL